MIKKISKSRKLKVLKKRKINIRRISSDEKMQKLFEETIKEYDPAFKKLAKE